MHILTTTDLHYFSEDFVTEKKFFLPFDSIPNTDGRFFCITYGQGMFIDFLKVTSMTLHTIVEALNKGDFIHTKRNFKQIKRNFLLRRYVVPMKLSRKLVKTQNP